MKAFTNTNTLVMGRWIINGQSLREPIYQAYNLNQYTSRGVPGTNDVIGLAHASATVTINGQTPSRKGEYYHREIGTNNSSSVSLWITNIATLGTNSQTITGRVVWRRLHCAFALVGLGVLLAAGCKQAPDNQRVDDQAQILDNLYQQYLSADLAKARQSLRRAVDVIVASENKRLIEDSLWLGYARLACLEGRAGEEPLARLYQEKARYWLLVELESSGVPVKEIIERIEEFTPQEMENTVAKWDNTRTKGTGPKYVRELQNRSRNSEGIQKPKGEQQAPAVQQKRV